MYAGKRVTDVNEPTFLDRTRAIIVPLVAATGILLLTITLVIGVICGRWFCHTNQYKESSGRATYHRSQLQIATESCPSAVYEQVCIGEYDQEQVLDLTYNIAYVSTQEITKTKNLMV